LTRRKPKTIDELFHELEEYIMSDEDHHRRVVERNGARQGKATQERRGDRTFKTHETSITWKIHSSIRTTDQTQEEVLHLGEEEGEVDPRNSQTITKEIHTSTANITEEVTVPKGAQKPRRTSLEFNKRKP
jgi:hypothetical protein